MSDKGKEQSITGEKLAADPQVEFSLEGCTPIAEVAILGSTEEWIKGEPARGVQRWTGEVIREVKGDE